MPDADLRAGGAGGCVVSELRPEPPFRTRGWIEHGVVIGPQGQEL